MKKVIYTSVFMLCAFFVIAQAPQKFNYQAVARNAQGAVLPSQNVKVRVSILDGSANGTSQYTETHSATTSQLGLFNLPVGGGTLVSGDFSTITWASGDKYLKIEMDATGGNNFSLVGTSQLLSVPFALFSEKSNIQAGNGISIINNVVQNTGDLDVTNELQSLSLNGNVLQISNGNEVSLPTTPAYTGGQGIEVNGTVINNLGDADNSNTNELQSLSLNGNVLQISNGNQVSLPTAPAYTGGQGIEVNGTVINNLGDADNSNTNELQSLSLNGNVLQISNGNQVSLPTAPAYTGGQGIEVNGTVINNLGDADNSPSNELQQISISGNTLSLSNGGSANLPTPSAGNGIAINGWQISNSGDLSATNELQTLSLTGNTLALSQNGGSVLLPTGVTSQWTTSGSNIYYNSGNVGIKTNSPASPLSFGNDLGDKVSMFYSNASSQYGLGLQNALFQIYCAASTDNIAFGYGSSSSFNEVMRIKGTGRVGIGTNNPSAKLDIVSADNTPTTEIARFMPNNLSQGPVIHWGGIQQGGTSANSNFEVNAKGTGHILLHTSPSGATASSGNVGIGINSPTFKLHVNGSFRVENEVSVGGGNIFSIDAPGVGGGRLKIGTDGKVTLGNTSTPGTYRLYVADGIMTERLKVALKSTGNWADYVFSNDYRLMPLEKVDKFIQENKHLPGVPSAAEVVETGIDVATMDAKLLEKIEELTLYMIDLKKENLLLKARIEALETKPNQTKN